MFSQFKQSNVKCSQGIWPLSFHKLCINMLLDRTTFETNSCLKVTSRGLKWEKKIYKLERSIQFSSDKMAGATSKCSF